MGEKERLASFICKFLEENAELVRLLVEKDSLHMQQDSMLVDIEDMIQ